MYIDKLYLNKIKVQIKVGEKFYAKKFLFSSKN